MKQTAVEWLREKLRLEFGFVFSDNILEQAETMFEEQIIDAYKTSHISMMTAEQYYKKTFKSE